ncbi:hypothetical protein WJU23_07155 [Prosthecobacter sp. SYSU 5D2]|uniref:hypothetical protein n=1 Tax=Prosthecobacter sp. SYSU 5D2 TaxID=3134134 RepID=UPI0031FE5A06
MLSHTSSPPFAEGFRPANLSARSVKQAARLSLGLWLLAGASLAAEPGVPQLVVTDAAAVTAVSGIPSDLGTWDFPATHAARPAQVSAIANGSSHSMVLKTDGSVAGWGYNISGQTTPPADLGPVSSISSGSGFTLAITADGTVRGWGFSYQGRLPVPPLVDVISISAGGGHSLALKRDGTVVAWGDNSSGQCTVPEGLTNVIAVAAGNLHSLALRSDGSVVAWGDNRSGQCDVPADVINVVAIAAGQWHSAALLADGSVRYWRRYWPLGNRPAAESLRDVVAISAGGYSVMALRRGGSVVAWGTYEANIPAGLEQVVSVSAGYVRGMALHGDGTVTNWDDPGYYTLWPRMPRELAPPMTGPDREFTHLAYLENRGTAVLTDVQAVIEGPDADQFSVLMTQVNNIAIGGESAFAVRYLPTRSGSLHAELKIYSNAPDSPFVIPLQGAGRFILDLTARKAGGRARNFTYGPLRLDRQTGLLLREIRFTNTLGVGLNGLRLILSRVPDGVSVFSSSPGDEEGTLEVLYSAAIGAGETVKFDLVYHDPKRRKADTILPSIRAEVIGEAASISPPVEGEMVPLTRIVIKPQGPLLRWKAKKNALYVVEYSDDGGAVWQSAIHVIRATTSTVKWVDRGQPETWTKPAISRGGKRTERQYRIKLQQSL